MAAKQEEPHLQKGHVSPLMVVSQEGTILDLKNISESPALKNANIIGGEINLYYDGAIDQEGKEGRFTVRTHPLSSAMSGADAMDHPDISHPVKYPQDPAFQFYSYNLTTVGGYICTGVNSSKSIGKFQVADRARVSPKELARMGMSWSSEEANVLVSQITIDRYTFTDPVTNTTVEMIDQQSTTPTGDPVGPRIVGVAAQTKAALDSNAWRVSVPLLVSGLVIVPIAGYLIYTVWVGAAATAAETAAVSISLVTGAAASGWTAGLIISSVAWTVGIILLAVLLIALIAWAVYAMTYDFAYFKIEPGPPAPVSTNDGVVVFEDGTVKFVAPPFPPALPTTGRRWTGATRTMAINEDGDLWCLNPDSGKWEQYLPDTPHKYISVAASSEWAGVIGKYPNGSTFLEIPAGKHQPAADSDIAKDVRKLNNGLNPQNGNKEIVPPVTGWKEFIPGYDYGLARANDGRVFGVGSNIDNQFDLKGTYTKISTARKFGYVEDDRYSLGIRESDGGIDFAGDDHCEVGADIKKAGLTNVRDIAAGQDRAIAVTSGGGIWNFGEEGYWHDTFISPGNSLTGEYTGISVAHLYEAGWSTGGLYQDMFVGIKGSPPPQPPVIEWQRTFGGSDYDFGEYITRTSNGDILILGGTRSSDGDMQGLNLHGFQDMVVARLSGDTGTPINKNLIGGPEADSDGKLILETPESYLLIGNTKALTGDFVNSNHHGDREHLNSDVSVVKVDKNNLLIIGTPFLYGGSDEDVVNWGVLSNDGKSVILTGYTYSNDGDFSGLNKGDADIFALKIDVVTGAVLAKNTYGGSGYDEGGSIVRSPDGSGYFIGGDTTSNDIAGLEGTNHGGTGGTKDAFIFYIDENLNRDNSRSWLIGGSSDDEIWSMDTTDDNQLVFTGSTNSNDGQIPSSKHGLAGVDDAWLVKINVQDGSILLNRCYGGQYPDYGMNIRKYQTGYLLLAQISSPPGDGDVISKYGGDDHTMDVWLLKLDQAGNIIYEKNLGGTVDDYAKRFGIQNSPGLMNSGYILGNTWSTDNDVSGNHGKMDMWVVKLKAAGQGVQGL